MSINNITAIYSGKDKESNMLSYANEFSVDFDVKAKCLYVMPEVETVVKAAFAGSTAIIMPDKYYDSVKADLKEKSEHAKIEFEALHCKNLNWQSETGNPKEVTAYYGKFSDLLIINKNISDDIDYSDVISSAIFETGRPIILYPENFEYKGVNKIVIGWDGSARAAKSVKSSLDILKKANDIIILTVDESQKDTSSVRDLIEYLASHGIKANHKNVSKIGRCVGDEILHEAKKQNSDLVVMGAYTHNKLQQMVFGGATKFILANTEIPVFMEH